MKALLQEANHGRRRVLAAALVAVAAAAVPLAFGAGRPVVYGDTFTLSGTVASDAAGQTVLVFARPYGKPKFWRVASVTTTAGGKWRYRARPAIETTYLASWGARTTSTVDVRVSPRLDLGLRRGVLSASARAARSLRGRALVVQVRRRGGAWRGVLRLVLDASSNARAPFAAPYGLSELRLFMPKSEAGAGYEGAFSPVLVYRNKA